MDRNAWTAARLAEALHVTEATVSRALALLKLPYTVQEAVESGALAPSTAVAVGQLPDASTQATVAAAIVGSGMTRAEAVETIRRAARPTKGRGAKGRKPTSRTFRTGACKVTVESKRGLDSGAIVAALRAALDQAEAETRDQAVAA